MSAQLLTFPLNYQNSTEVKILGTQLMDKKNILLIKYKEEVKNPIELGTLIQGKIGPQISLFKYLTLNTGNC